MYFSSSLYYSSKYTKGGSDDGNPFIICMVTPGNVYPGLIIIYLFIYLIILFLFDQNNNLISIKKMEIVTESPYLEGPVRIQNPHGFIQRPCKLGYQSHYTLGFFLSFFLFLSKLNQN